MSPADLAALWDEARATLSTDLPLDHQLFSLARGGHRNAIPIVHMLTPGDGCTCGEDVPCEGVETPERVKRREAFTRLAKALEEPRHINLGRCPYPGQEHLRDDECAVCQEMLEEA